MNENLFENKEQPAIRVEIAKPEDWPALKEIRLVAINSEDAEMFGPRGRERDQIKTDEDWKQEVSIENKNTFYVLGWNGNKVMGMVRATHFPDEPAVWRVTSLYSRADSRGKIVPKKVFGVLKNEILRRGGTRIIIHVNPKNTDTERLYKLFGFAETTSFSKKIKSDIFKLATWKEMTLDLTKDGLK